MTTNDLNTTSNITADEQAVSEPTYSGGYRQAELTLPAGMADFTVQPLPAPYGPYYTKVVITGNELDNKISINPTIAPYNLELRGGAGKDQLTGGSWDDTLSGGAGADTMKGGSGNDTYVVDDPGDVVQEPASSGPQDTHLTAGTDTVISALDYALTDLQLENLTLTGNARSGTGNEHNNVMRLTDLGGTLSGQAGDDSLWGGLGNDTLNGGEGADFYALGGGNDLVLDAGSTGVNTLAFSKGTDLGSVRFTRSDLDLLISYDAKLGATQRSVARVSNYFDSATSLESSRWVLVDEAYDNGQGVYPGLRVDVAGSMGLTEGDDVLQLERGTGLVITGGGNDLISIFGSYAAVSGGAGNDTIDGHAAMSYIVGGEGNDSIWGASSLYGGAGDDHLGVVVGTYLADGGAGSNTYKLGDGARFLTVMSSDDTSVNTIRFQVGPNGLAARPEDIEISGTGDTFVNLHQLGTSTFAKVQMTPGQTWRVAFDNGVVWSAADLVSLTHKVTEFNDTLLGLSGNDTFSGRGGDDFLTGNDGNDVLQGDAGADRLYGGFGNDTLEGGAGNDTLFGDVGDDTYVVGRQGNDTIVNYALSSGESNAGVDILRFTDGIKASEVSVTARSYDNSLTLSYQGGSLLIENFFSGKSGAPAERFQSFVFADGERWERARLETLNRLGTDNNDALSSSTLGVVMEGLGGDDVLFASSDASTLLGGAGNDQLSGGLVQEGGEGNDTLVSSAVGPSSLRGGAGNDSIDGNGTLADRIHFDRGDGHDLVNLDEGDTVVFGAGLQRADLKVVERVDAAGGTRLVFQFGPDNSLTLSTRGGAYSPDKLPVVNFEFADGARFTGVELINQQRGYLLGSKQGDVLRGSEGNEALWGLSGKDRLIGGLGNDTLKGGRGADTFVFNRGDGADVVLTVADDLEYAYYLGETQPVDALQLGAGIRPDDLAFSKVNGGYQIKVLSASQDVGDSITLLTPGLYATSIVFDDGNVYRADTILSILEGYAQPGGFLLGSMADDTLVAYQGATDVLALDGDDRIIGGPSNDRIDGGAGNDTLVLNAAMSFDTYTSHGDAAGDVIELSGGLSLSDFVVLVATPAAGSTDATMNLWRKDGQGALTIVDQLATGQSRTMPVSGLPGLRQSDGTFFSVDELYARRQQGTSGSDTLYGGNIQGVVLEGGGGADTFVLNSLAKNVTIQADASDTIDLSSMGRQSLVATTLAFRDGKAQLSFWQADAGGVLFTLQDAEAVLGTQVRFADGQNATVRDLAGLGLSVPYGSENVSLTGWVGADTLQGSDGPDTLIGLAGNDVLIGAYGADLLKGGEGNDSLTGGESSDTYAYERGDGHDTIVADNLDIISFGTGIVASDLVVGALGATAPGTVVLQIKRPDGASSDTITLKDASAFAGLRFFFADGSALIGGGGLSLQPSSVGAGSPADDVLNGTSQNDSLLGLAGSDRLTGGKGDDTLEGGAGVDQYFFNRGDGSDVIRINEGEWSPRGSTDTLRLGAGIRMDDLSLTTLAGGYQISILQNGLSTGDRVTVRAPANAALSIGFADGNVWSGEQVETYLGGAVPGGTLNGTGGDDTLLAFLGSSLLIGLSGNDVLRGQGGDDTLDGGPGNDSLYGGGGADFLSSKDGANYLEGGQGADQITVGVSGRASFDDTIRADGSDVIRVGLGFGAQFEVLPLGSSGPNEVVLTFVAPFPVRTGRITLLDAGQWDGLTLNIGESVYTGAQIMALATNPPQDLALTGTAGSDLLEGKGGSDTLSGLDGNDTLNGGLGNDSLRGGFGADTYVFNRGDGRDTISVDEATSDPAQLQANRDVLALGAGIRLDDFKLSRIDKGFRLDFTDGGVLTGDSIDIDVGAGAGVNHSIRFDDGNTLDLTSLDAMLTVGYQPIGNMTGTDGNDTLRAFKGGANIVAGDGNDRILTGPGNDTIHAGKGADVLVFGAGSGQDLYVAFEDAAQDIIELTGNLGLNDFIVNTQPLAWPTALSLVLKDGTGALLMTDQASDGTGRLTPISNLPSVKLADGTLITAADLHARRQQGTDGADTLYADPFAPVNGGKGNDRLIAGALGGNLSGGEGNDTLVAGTGSAVLHGGLGADTFVLGRMADTLRGVSQEITADSADTLEYAPGIQRSDVQGRYQFNGQSVNLALKLAGNERSTVYVSNIADAAGLSVKFSDGTLVKAIDLAPVEGLSLYGQSGDETLKGFLGNDTLEGSTGNDLLDGGAGADTYTYRSGDGKDTIVADSADILEFQTASADSLTIGKLGASAANAVVLGSGADGSGGTVTLTNAGQWAGLQVKLGDGTVITGAQILAAATKPDNLTLNGTAKADKLTGKDGNDTLNGLAGNDTLAGGKGNDSLIGGKGNDTYLFNRGEGQDVIVDNDSTWFNSDLLKVGGATSKQLWLTKSGSNLDIKVLGTTDKVTVQNWFAGSANQVEKITASDGKSLSANKVQALVNAMASFTPPADAASLPANAPAALTKLVASSWV